MRWWLVTLALSLAAAGALRAEEADSPHSMVKANGEADSDKCAVCHEADLSLSRSKRETCTLCHAETLHAGAYLHLHASPDKLKRLLSAGHEEEKPELPKAEDGGIFCGTCHLFHDARLSEDKPLAMRRPPTAFDKTVQNAIEAQWPVIAKKYDAEKADASFATKATKALRLPVDDGTLCRHCHGSAPR
jgi:hypothetical protein